MLCIIEKYLLINQVLAWDWKIFFCLTKQLETDAKILLEKADTALKKNQMHMVVANELSTRKEEVVVVTATEKISVRRDKTQVGDDVENHLIGLLVERHSAYLENPDLWYIALTASDRWYIQHKFTQKVAF